MNLDELWTVLEALPWHEVEARKIVADAIEQYYWPDPYRGEPATVAYLTLDHAVRNLNR